MTTKNLKNHPLLTEKCFYREVKVNPTKPEYRWKMVKTILQKK